MTRRGGHRARGGRPNGLGVEEYWAATLAGRAASAGSPASTRPYPARLAGEVRTSTPSRPPAEPAAAADRPHDPARAGRRRLGARRTPASTRRDCPSTTWAWSRPAPPAASSSASGSWRSCGARAREYVSAYQSFAWFYAVNTGQISIRHGMRGPSGVLVAEQAGGLDAVGQARRQLRKGTRWSSPAASTRRCARGAGSRSSPAAGSAPSDGPGPRLPALRRDASGYVPGEGGAILVVEDAAAARARGAARLRRDRRVRRDLRPAARQRAARPACAGRSSSRSADAGRADPTTSTWSSPTRPGVPELDRAEAEAITAVFGPGGSR
jgi:act minimal PKS chain-length factor (CLF/KS beta)